MTAQRSWVLLIALAFALWFDGTVVMAQTESATAEDGAPVSEATGPTTISTVPPVQLGANLTPPLGVPPLLPRPSAGQSGDTSVNTAAGSISEGIAREGANAVRAPEAAPAEPETTCGDFPTWYDAQLVLESSIDPAVIASLDPDGDAIACEDLMYP
jgi:hypothetical protein